jgi:hypothetical protein
MLKSEVSLFAKIQARRFLKAILDIVRVPSAEEGLNNMTRLSISPRKLVNRSGFNLNYDDESPLRRIDIGGPDQQQRSESLIVTPVT